LDEDNAWYCDKCDSMALALKELHVKAFPPILVIHLNRFKTVDNKKVKNCESIMYQPVEEFGGKEYRLQAVIIHEGSMEGGHYWCIAHRGSDYYIFNDSKVNKTDKVFNRNAYILIYQLA
jgi:ubiquitin C-terminal hydrolase